MMKILVVRRQKVVNEKDSFETGQCFIMYVEFRDNDGNYLEPRQGKNRPVVIFKDPSDNNIFACQTTGQIDKPLYRKNGVLIQDFQEAGMKKETIIRLEYHSRYKIENPENLKGPIGKLSERDIDNFLEKLVKVRQREYNMENSLEL